MAYLVSPCCGAEYSEHIDIDGYDVFICQGKKCNEIFTEPIEDYEFNEAVKEAKAEAAADERRDLGL